MHRALTTTLLVAFLLTAGLSSVPAAASSFPAHMQMRPLLGSCRATISGFSFGAFSAITQTGRLAQSFVTFNCPSVVAEIDLSSGASGGFEARNMTSHNDGRTSIAYNIYLDAARTIVFGDGGAGSSPYIPGSGVSQGSFPIYAEIALGQANLAASDYSDTLNITIRMAQ